MISSIFGKTKPINYVILLAFLFILYFFVHLFYFNERVKNQDLWLRIATVFMLLLSVFVINFILHRNKITATNSYGILFFTLIITIFPEVLSDWRGIGSNFFLLLALRRILSLKSLQNIKGKIFDATIWIAVASLFYDWALIYLVVLFVAIAQYEPKNFRNWLVPIAGLFTTAVLLFSILLVTKNLEILENHYRFSFALDVSFFSKWQNSVKLGGFLFLTIISAFFSFVRLGKSVLGRIVTLRLIALYFTIGIIVTLFKSSATVFPILLTFFATAVFVTNYIENIKKPNVKEILLMASILFPIAGLVIGAAIK